ncbi:hypothetical protein MED297_09941 [Reinekea sp. MED297]|uniref:TVP38/TMEM64 family membrane protein n=2 Tax=Reinekea TaxID=230494 RepID=A4BA66_9GAMM|nr:hypothetical protein MED297_09941 [Reinekea sp. MED297] [Reinekea blandensis MED297]
MVTLISLIILVSQRGDGLLDMFTPSEPSVSWLIITLCFYALLLAIPFMPSVEVGWLIMAMFGLPGIVGAWIATWVGLMTGFFAGRLFRKTAWYQQRLTQVENRYQQQQTSSDPGLVARAVSLSRRRPVFFVAVALNVPGNWVIGGGGGVALLASLVLMMPWWRFLMIIIPATGVVPVALMLGLMPVSALN